MNTYVIKRYFVPGFFVQDMYCNKSGLWAEYFFWFLFLTSLLWGLYSRRLFVCSANVIIDCKRAIWQQSPSWVTVITDPEPVADIFQGKASHILTSFRLLLNNYPRKCFLFSVYFRMISIVHLLNWFMFINLS